VKQNTGFFWKNPVFTAAIMMTLYDEPLDVYNACGEALGRTKPRHAVHRDGDWHRTFHCWVIYTDTTGQDMVVFQQRSAAVELWPEKLDITAAGHYRAGEGIEGGIREIEEELGLGTTVDQLLYAGIRVNVDEFQPGMRNHEFQEVYFLINDQALTAYRPQIEEVAGLAAIPIPFILKLFAREISQITVSGISWESSGSPSPSLLPSEMTYSLADVIPSLDQYYQRVALTAQRILRGENYFWI
jgi:isopentenyldiphosphate isomerase